MDAEVDKIQGNSKAFSWETVEREKEMGAGFAARPPTAKTTAHGHGGCMSSKQKAAVRGSDTNR